MLTALGAQYAIGDHRPVSDQPGMRYDPRGYQAGFGAFFMVQLLALGWYLAGRRSLTAAASA